MADSDNNLGIKVISVACGIVPHTIRTWESRYKVFQPTRGQKGERLYSKTDLNRAKLIARLIEEGHTISKIARLDERELKSLLGVTGVEESSSKKEEFLNSISIKELLKYLSDYKIDLVASEIQHLRMSVGAKEFIFGIVLPVMQKIGVMVANGEYSVTQEHIVSTIIRDQLGQITLPNVGDLKKKIILATPDGNLHELSIIIADILCRANRYSTSYLGASHPAECLGEAISILKCDTVVMGVVSSDLWDYEKNIISYLTEMDSHLKHPIKVILGGGWQLDFPKYKNISVVDIMPNFEVFDEALASYEI